MHSDLAQLDVGQMAVEVDRPEDEFSLLTRHLQGPVVLLPGKHPGETFQVRFHKQTPFFPTARHIFLCHANEDKPQVREVYKRLKAEGFEPWLDEEDLFPGQLWEQEIRMALKNSDFILIFFSQNLLAKRGYVQREMQLALDTWEEISEGQIHTIPVRLDDCEIPERFKRFQWVQIFEERGWRRLIRAIRFGLEQRQ